MHFLGITLLVFALLLSTSKAKFACYSRYFLTSYFCILVPYNEKDIFFVTVDSSMVRCCKEQYCVVTWNVRSMNQGKLEVVKQEMARMNIDILRIRELKWMGMGEFNSDDHYIYYCGQESLRRNGVIIIVNKRV